MMNDAMLKIKLLLHPLNNDDGVFHYPLSFIQEENGKKEWEKVWQSKKRCANDIVLIVIQKGQATR